VRQGPGSHRLVPDTTGIDVGDIAEKASFLTGSIPDLLDEQSDLPMMCIVLRKGTAAAHYIMGGPQANNNNAFTLGTPPTTEIYVMHGETHRSPLSQDGWSRRRIRIVH